MTIGIENERPVIVGVVLGAKAGTAVVAAADFERRGTYGPHRLVHGSRDAFPIAVTLPPQR
jgi:hypothetical protein